MCYHLEDKWTITQDMNWWETKTNIYIKHLFQHLHCRKALQWPESINNFLTLSVNMSSPWSQPPTLLTKSLPTTQPLSGLPENSSSEPQIWADNYLHPRAKSTWSLTHWKWFQLSLHKFSSVVTFFCHSIPTFLLTIWVQWVHYVHLSATTREARGDRTKYFVTLYLPTTHPSHPAHPLHLQVGGHRLHHKACWQ